MTKKQHIFVQPLKPFAVINELCTCNSPLEIKQIENTLKWVVTFLWWKTIKEALIKCWERAANSSMPFVLLLTFFFFTLLDSKLLFVFTALYMKGNDVTKLASMAKLKGGRLARELADSCLQYWGGMGYTSDVLVSRFYRSDSSVILYTKGLHLSDWEPE